MDFRKQQNKNLSLNNDYSNITIFKDKSFAFLYKKTEKISTAIYLVTNLMSTEEPLKWRLRKTSLSLLESIMSLSNKTMSSRDKCLRDISKKLFETISLYNVSFRSGFISEMNYKIVDNELNNLSNFISQYDTEDRNYREELFNEDYFNTEMDNIGQDELIKDANKGDLKNHDRSGVFEEEVIKDNSYKRQSKGQSNHFNKNENMSFKKTTPKNNVNKTNSNNKSIERNKRREDIVNIIKQKEIVSVKDISNIIKDTSEKTIQRELISMVNEGILLKEGERRWSRYSMVNKT